MEYPTRIIVRKRGGQFVVLAQFRTNQGKAFRRKAFVSQNKKDLRKDLGDYLAAWAPGSALPVVGGT